MLYNIYFVGAEHTNIYYTEYTKLYNHNFKYMIIVNMRQWECLVSNNVWNRN